MQSINTPACNPRILFCGMFSFIHQLNTKPLMYETTAYSLYTFAAG